MQGEGLAKSRSHAAPRSIETLGEEILNLSGQIDLPITLETSHYLFNTYMYLYCIYSVIKIFMHHSQSATKKLCPDIH